MDAASVRPPAASANGLPPVQLRLELNVTDAEAIQELLAQAEGRAREEYALRALKLGLLALRQARGQLDADTVRREGDRLLGQLKADLQTHASLVQGTIDQALMQYFHPDSGRFPERIKRLVDHDGELATLLRGQIGSKDSELVKTLAAHVGQDSPLFKMLSPKESEGVLAALRATLTDQLAIQREQVLKEFDLNRQESALRRLVDHLTQTHGDLGRDLGGRFETVMKEFSLDQPESALSKMVERIRQNSEAIDKHLSLDNKDSALARLKAELLELFSRQGEASQKFQEEVKVVMAELRAKREADRRSPEHGRQFEQLVVEWIQRDGQQHGDVVSATGSTVGLIKARRVGDAVLELGPEQAAAGAKIVIEAKELDGYTLQQARQEMEEARKNRAALVGLFVCSRKTAPPNQPAFQRLGDDVFVVWDADDPATDVFLQAGLSVARALCTRQARQRDTSTADFAGISKAILAIEKHAENYDHIRKSAETIKSGAEKILERVRIDEAGIRKQVDLLQGLIADLKRSVWEEE